jgi:hypothetical protein
MLKLARIDRDMIAIGWFVAEPLCAHQPSEGTII